MVSRTPLFWLIVLMIGVVGPTTYECTGRESVSAPPPEEREELDRAAERHDLEAEIGEAARDEALGESSER